MFCCTGLGLETGEGKLERKLPGDTPTIVFESIPMEEMTRPLAVVGDRLAAVTFPELF